MGYKSEKTYAALSTYITPTSILMKSNKNSDRVKTRIIKNAN